MRAGALAFLLFFSLPPQRVVVTNPTQPIDLNQKIDVYVPKDCLTRDVQLKDCSYASGAETPVCRTAVVTYRPGCERIQILTEGNTTKQ